MSYDIEINAIRRFINKVYTLHAYCFVKQTYIIVGTAIKLRYEHDFFINKCNLITAKKYYQSSLTFYTTVNEFDFYVYLLRRK